MLIDKAGGVEVKQQAAIGVLNLFIVTDTVLPKCECYENSERD